MNYKYRIEQLRLLMEEKQLETIFVFNPDHQFYLSGFKAFTYSRPIILCFDKVNSTYIIPGLEKSHAEHSAHVDNLLVYYEHPKASTSHEDYFDLFLKLLPKPGTGAKIGVDLTSTPGHIYKLLRDSKFEIVDIGPSIEKMRYIKDQEEINWLIKAGELVNLAVSESIKAIEEGISEMEVDAAGNMALFAETALKYPEATLDLNVMTPSGVKRTNMPHVFSNTRKIQSGDVIIHTRQVGLNGYRAELERTVVVGKPTEMQRKAFELAVEAQRRAIDYIKPGVKASEVDLIAREVFEKNGLGKYAIHRVGHGIGVSAHETPYLRFDNDELIIEEGMVFSIEPGIYIPEVGGFRHSDTVVITADGCQLITDYPYEVDQLII